MATRKSRRNSSMKKQMSKTTSERKYKSSKRPTQEPTHRGRHEQQGGVETYSRVNSVKPPSAPSKTQSLRQSMITTSPAGRTTSIGQQTLTTNLGRGGARTGVTQGAVSSVTLTKSKQPSPHQKAQPALSEKSPPPKQAINEPRYKPCQIPDQAKAAKGDGEGRKFVPWQVKPCKK